MSRMSLAAKQKAVVKKMGREWTPFQPIPITDQMRKDNPVLEHCHSIHGNSRYEVQVFPCSTRIGGVMQMTVRRHADIEDISWDELQRVKAEVFGPNHTAMEIYPPKSAEWHPSVNVRVLWIMPLGWVPDFGLHTESAWGRS